MLSSPFSGSFFLQLFRMKNVEYIHVIWFPDISNEPRLVQNPLK